MATFDHLTRRRLLGMAGITLASPLLMSLPGVTFAADEHAGHNKPAPTGGKRQTCSSPRNCALS